MQRMILLSLLAMTSTALGLTQSPARSNRRAIDRCAQDGIFFHGIDDSSFGPGDRPQSGKPVVIERDGVTVTINWNPKQTLLTLAHAGQSRTLAVNGLNPTLGYLTVGQPGFALSWSENSHDWSTQLFTFDPQNGIVENTSLVASAEKQFQRDAKRFCSNPNNETSVIKWIDGSHLLIAIDAWGDATCNSTFTEGFVLDVRANRIERKLTEQELIHLPAVCTWNVVPMHP